ncbi:enoyl-CoA hydratase-related protein [soil metagenome]
MNPARRRDQLTWSSAGELAHLLIARLDAVAVLQLNRPDARNALSDALFSDLAEQLALLDHDQQVRSIVLSGGNRLFAAGADIDELVGASPIEMRGRPRLAQWHLLGRIRKPLIAAVNGYALGGGCELALACDIIVAGESARFGLPEVGLGLIPGGGGTQRLVRAIGKARAMDVILTGRMLSASEALDGGLISRVVPDELCLGEAVEIARAIADRPPHAVQLAKDATLHAFDSSLESGLEYERRLFELLFSTSDAQEGLSAFRAKREPQFVGK